jgi:hypothetical protein
MMNFIDRYLFRIISTVIISIGISGCTQDPMIRVDNKSQLQLLANTEIRYKACGDTAEGCQQIFQNIDDEKSKIRDIAHTKYDEYTANARQEYELSNKNAAGRCIARTYVHTFARQPISSECEQIISRPFMIVGFDESSRPTQAETKNIIKEVSNTHLNQYTYSKSDGSIVVLCPTRYCAIASLDGAWIGVGERGISKNIVSVVKGN